MQRCFVVLHLGGSISAFFQTPPLSTAIGLEKYRIPSDLQSQAECRLASTTVGDHVGILGAVVFARVLSSGPGEISPGLPT